MLKQLLTVTVSVILLAVLVVPICESYGDPSPNELDVLVISGQSNGAYMETTTVHGVTNVICDPDDVNGNVPLPHKNAYYYGTALVPILYGAYYETATYDTTLDSYAIHPMTSEGAWIIGGEEAAIASALTARSYHDVLIINVCAPGAPIEFYEDGATGAAYSEKVIEDALSKLDSKYRVNKLGFVWIQGESNKTTAIADYISSFESVKGFYEDLGFDTCYMVQTKPGNSGNAADAQLQICNTNPDCILASTAPSTFTVSNGLLVSDDIHYSQLGRNIVGHDIGMAIPVYSSDHPEKGLIMLIPWLLIAAIIVSFTAAIFIRRAD